MTRNSVRRPALLGAAWTASAAAAIGLGFLAVSLVDASAAPDTSPVAATATATTTPASPDTTSGGAPPAPLAAATGEYATVGGTVFADCTSGLPVLAGVPAAGWWVDPSDDLGKMEFENDDDDVDVYVVCVDGAPQFALDDSPGSHSSAASSSPAAPSTSGRDDSDGRIGGGHGSDDGPGDDSSGRSGGGHGSDDGPGDDSSGRDGGGHGSDD